MINEQQSRLFTDPLEIIKRDKKKMKSEKKKWDKQLELVENQLAKIKDVLKKSMTLCASTIMKQLMKSRNN